MTQQLDHTAAPLTNGPAVAPTVAVPMPRSAPPRSHLPVAPPAGLGYGPNGGLPPVPPRRRSAGRVVAVVAGIAGAGVVLLVCLALVLSSLFATASPAPGTPAVPTVPAPTSAPAVPATPGTPDPGGTVVPAESPAGVRLFLAPAGKRLEAARATLGQELTAAGRRKDLPAFRAAFAHFDRELDDYRAVVTGLPVPPGREAAFASLTSSVDATLADGHELEGVRTRGGLSAPAGRFDGHWSALVDAHNQLLHALATA